MLTYLFLAFLVGLGVLMMVISPSVTLADSQYDRLEKLRAGEIKLNPEDGFFKNWRKHGLDIALYQAELPVSRIGFIRTGTLISGVVAIAVFAITSSPLVALAAFFGGFFFYIRWLFQRRDNKRLEYEEAVADVCDRLASGAQQMGNLTGSVQYAVDLSPSIIKGDLKQVLSLLNMNYSVSRAFEETRKRRNSYALNVLVDTLIAWQRYGFAKPLHEILAPLATTVRERASERKLREAELSGARSQMGIVAIAPFFFVIMLKTASPEFGGFYASMNGQLLQFLGYGISAVGYLMGDKILNSVRKTMNLSDESGG